VDDGNMALMDAACLESLCSLNQQRKHQHKNTAAQYKYTNNQNPTT
jgi:hypothetical protein